MPIHSGGMRIIAHQLREAEYGLENRPSEIVLEQIDAPRCSCLTPG